MRCSEASQARGEPMVGTASTVTSFLLLECPGPWGVQALRDSRLPDEVKQWLRAQRGVRPLLIRRAATTTTKVFVSRGASITTTGLSDVREVVELDLAGDLAPYDGELFLVCTHGRHDVCCAERGRPLWQALARVAPDETWQVSHIGGDRFAANVLVLPHGLYYGRLGPDDVERFVEVHRAGGLDLEHLRGRSAYPFDVQAAEVFLRRKLGQTDIRPFVLRRNEGATTVFEVGESAWEVEVERRTTRELLTCHASEASAGWTFALVGITEVGA